MDSLPFSAGESGACIVPGGMSQADDLFSRYSVLPRADALGASVLAGAKKAQLAALVTLVGAFLLGVPLSFVRFRRSHAWEPLDMVWGGVAIAIFTVPIALVAVVLLRRYVKLFRAGRAVPGVVVQQRGSGVVLQVATGIGPDRTFVPNLRAEIGARFPVLIGDAMSSLALVAVAPGELRRGSLLTEQQLGQLVVG